MADAPDSPEVVDVDPEAQDEVQETVNDPADQAEPVEQEYEDPNAGGYSEPVEDVPAQSDEEAFMMKAQGCIAALVVASCAELAQAARYCDTTKLCSGALKQSSAVFAVCVGAISLGFNVLFGAGLYFKPDAAKPFIAYLAVAMTVLWGFGVAVCTFDAPFDLTGNGYFATWGAAIISVYFCQISFSKFNAILGKAFTSAVAGSLERRVMMIIMIFSYVCAFASLTKTTGGWIAQEKWGFACGLTCGGIITVYMLLKTFTNLLHGKGVVVKYMSYLLTGMWLFGVGVLTFDAPFTTTGNGYFTAWGSFLTSIYLAYITTLAPSTSETPADS